MKNSSSSSPRVCKISPSLGDAVRTARLFSTAAVAAVLLIVSLQTARAGSATWKTNPDSGDWNNAGNWSAGGPPNGAADVATFDASNLVAVFLTANTEVDGTTFATGAFGYSILPHPGSGLTFSGAGIVNNSANTQTFTTYVEGLDRFASSYIRFTNSASAGHRTTFINVSPFDPSVTGHGSLEFLDKSSAASANITNRGGRNVGASTDFYNSSTAAGANVTNQGAVSEGYGGSTIFHDTSDAGHAILMNTATGTDLTLGGFTEFRDASSAAHALIFVQGVPNSGLNRSAYVRFLDQSTAANSIIVTGGSAAGAATTTFFGQSTAGNAVLIASGDQTGGRIEFAGNSTGGTARVELFDRGSLKVNTLSGSLTIGSIEGDGLVFLGPGTLTVGSNNMNTEFSGVIGDNGAAGSLAKIGIGTLSLSGANTYTGSTAVNAGKLIVNGSITSAVTVNGGALGGSGTTGSVTVHKGGVLAPGNSPGILDVIGNLTLTLGATYLVDLNGVAVGKEYDQLNVIGLVSLDDATLSLNLGFAAVPGTVFTIISNDLSDAITGTFDDLPEGANFAAAGQTFTITYHGGDGNDVAVESVVPEPATWALVSAGAALLIVVGRRRGSRV